MAVNSYLVHGPDGVVVVDGQLTRQHADDDAALRQAAVVERMRAIVPDERLAFLMQLSTEPVCAALAGGGR